MKAVLLGITLLCVQTGWSQQTTLPVPVAGLETPWSVQKIIAGLQKDTAQLQPLLQQINPQQWSNQKGAPTTYMLQWQTAHQQLNDVMVTTKLFSQKTESLSAALDVYFRLEALETTERALGEGIGRYDTRATADQWQTMIAHNFDSRQRLRDYLRDLAATTEQNFKIADGEAQRCRGMISREAPVTSGKKSKRN
ncbi:MAG: hypothetical protein JO182_01535 [Acidobacteriaceae bacterium]|nr:hypothetical protein [Acidobacteriaceae bacterium]MBV9033146.1 hypothetical protein [Acidobacteriaceae bacterium]MBV9676189.1 hypothetical protein [Acidobacteriaceae bacterium]MBV9937791.1 hypothetical protein [Acidobacteriaceae bacterium]